MSKLFYQPEKGSRKWKLFSSPSRSRFMVTVMIVRAEFVSFFDECWYSRHWTLVRNFIWMEPRDNIREVNYRFMQCYLQCCSFNHWSPMAIGLFDQQCMTETMKKHPDIKIYEQNKLEASLEDEEIDNKFRPK